MMRVNNYGVAFLTAYLLVGIVSPRSLRAQIPDGELKSPATASDVGGNLHLAMLSGSGREVWTTVLDAATGKWGTAEFLGFPTQSGDVVRTGPALTATNTGVYLFIADKDGRVVRRFRPNDGRWGGWADMGGVATSMLSAVSTPNGTVFVFARGTDNRFYFASGSADTWTSWQAIDGVSNMTSAPAAAGISGGFVIVGRGSDGRGLWGNTYQNGTWSTWRELGKTVGSTPTAWGDGGRNAYVSSRNSDGTIQVFHFDDTLKLLEDLKVTASSTLLPSTSWMNGSLTLVTTGSNDGRQWYAQRGSGGFGGWNPVLFPNLSTGKYIADIDVVAGDGPGVWCPEGYGKNGQDLNEGVGGKYIYLCIKRTDNKQDGLTDLTLINWDNVNPTVPDTRGEIVFGVSGVCGNGTPDATDLNLGAKGSYLFLCKTKSCALACTRLTDVKVHSYSSWPSTENGRCPDSGYSTIDIADGSRGSARDLNDGSGGKFIYACLKFE